MKLVDKIKQFIKEYNNNGWIDVKDRLPTKKGLYLILHKNSAAYSCEPKELHKLTYYKPNLVLFTGDNFIDRYDNLFTVYWKELPKFPAFKL